jgi:hypothetical protein
MMQEYEANPVRVHAADIEGVQGDEKNPKRGVAIILRNDTGLPMVIHLTPEMVSRHWPRKGDYYVIQSDDYRYINPKEVFERKYHLVPKAIAPDAKPVSPEPEPSDPQGLPVDPAAPQG